MEGKKAKVFIVDDYAPMRESLRKMLELEADLDVCGEASDVDTAYQGIQTTQPDIVVLDLVLGRQSGLELLTRLGPQLSQLPVLILSMLPESLNAQAVLNKGARGYIMKSESPDQILAAIRQVLKGHVYLSPVMIQELTKLDPTTQNSKRRLS